MWCRRARRDPGSTGSREHVGARPETGLGHSDITGAGRVVVAQRPADVDTAVHGVEERRLGAGGADVDVAGRDLRDGVGETELDELEVEVLLLELAEVLGEQDRCHELGPERGREPDRLALGERLRRLAPPARSGTTGRSGLTSAGSLAAFSPQPSTDPSPPAAVGRGLLARRGAVSSTTVVGVASVVAVSLLWSRRRSPLRRRHRRHTPPRPPRPRATTANNRPRRSMSPSAWLSLPFFISR